MKLERLLILIVLTVRLTSGCGANPEAAKAELQKMKQENKITDVSEENFVLCAQMGNRDAVHLYLASKMGINVRNKEGRTPLMGAVAADSGSPWFDRNEEIVRYLIQNGADVNVIDHYGSSPFQLAKSLTRLNILRILIEAGAKEYPAGPPTPTPVPEGAPVPMM